MPIRVVLVEDDRQTRETLIELLDRESDIEVIAEAADGKSAMVLVRDVSPDIVVMGVFLPRLNGIQATEFIVSENPEVKVILMSTGFEKVFVDYLLRLGAGDCILKEHAGSELAQAIREVVEGSIYRGGSGLVPRRIGDLDNCRYC
jgi:DNA-binding NarL/FixJ family response regulator